MQEHVSVLVRGKVYDLGQREGDVVRVAMRGEWPEVPWHMVERWRTRASYHRFGDAPWRDNAEYVA
jgi:hypothetical protein